MGIFIINDDSINKAWSGENGYCFSMKDYTLKNVDDIADPDINDGFAKSQLMISNGYIPDDNGYWLEAVKELYNAIKAAPSIPMSSKLYVLDIGSKYQQVLVTRESVKLQLQKTSSNPWHPV